MADIYFPNVMSALPEPRFVEPQSNTGAMAMGSALQALTSVAGNFRQKEMNVQKANQMADALEKEGLAQEANLYRQAAQSYQMDFFATPQENERFNQSLLNDTLRLLANKQEREMKAEQLKLETQYKRSLIENQEAEALRAGRRLTLDERLAGIREKEFKQETSSEEEALLQKEQRNKILGLDATSDNIRQQITQNQKAYDELSSLRESGSLSQEEFARKAAPYIDTINNSKTQLNNIQKEIFRIQNIEANLSQETQLGIPLIKSRQEKILEAQAEADRVFAKNPSLKEYPVPGVGTFANPKFETPTRVTTVTGTDAQGLPINRIERNEFVQPGATATGTGRDPNAPYVPKSRY